MGEGPPTERPGHTINQRLSTPSPSTEQGGHPVQDTSPLSHTALCRLVPTISCPQRLPMLRASSLWAGGRNATFLNQTKPNQTELNQELPKLAWRHTGEDRPWVLPLQPPCCGPELALGPPPNPGAPLRPSWSVQPGLPVGGWGIKDDGRETDADPSESRPSAIGDTTSPLASWTSTLIPVRTTIGPFRLQGQSLRGQVQRTSREHPPFP